MATSPRVLWEPSAERIAGSRLTHFTQWLAAHREQPFRDYQELWQWSVDDLEGFWSSIWDYFGVRCAQPYSEILSTHALPGAQWFSGSRLNFAEQLFRFNTDAASAGKPAIVAESETRERVTLSWGELRSQVAAVANALRALGVGPGDRVVSYLPNTPEAAVAFFACASIGAIWSSCSPDMGSTSVLDRFRQIDPKVLLAVDGYRYGGKDFPRLDVVDAMRGELATLEHTVLLPYLDPQAALPGALRWNDLLSHPSAAGDMRFEPLPFDHPLWILYSSGTTGMPKPIVHGHGGTLLETLKSHALALDLGEDDRFLWFSTTGWVMWNSQVTGLLVGATICIYDGNPGYPDLGRLWRFAAEQRITFMGAGAAFFANCMKAGIAPAAMADLSPLRAVGSTGSPLAEEAYEWIYREVKQDILLASISGGTDIAAAFVGACPNLPVYAGEMQCRSLGVAVRAYDDHGNELIDEVGELVVTEPMPSMPLYFWNDPDNRRYHESYFAHYTGVWRHGDWIRITPRGGAVIYGRSDATINRHGVRMGTAEIYRVVEDFDEVLDSLVVDLEYLGRESWMPLFVVLREGVALDESLERRIGERIRTQLSARHVPNAVIAVPEVPRTLTGKKMELPVKKLLLGMAVEKVANPDAMANPQSLQWFVAFARERQAA
jgi:acetoacetyl-CoA synthetase